MKPLSLMRWLVRLVTPPGGTCVDPFAGSGATIEAALLEGFNVIGIEREAEYLPLIMQRIQRVDEARAAVALLPDPEPSLFDDDEPPPAARAGRWPANVVLDRSQAEALDLQSGTLHSQGGSRGASGTGWGMEAQAHIKPGYGDVGGASRFFLTVDPDDEGDAA